MGAGMGAAGGGRRVRAWGHSRTAPASQDRSRGRGARPAGLARLPIFLGTNQDGVPKTVPLGQIARLRETLARRRSTTSIGRRSSRCRPTSIIGVVLALLVTGDTLNIMSMIGVILLFGIRSQERHPAHRFCQVGARAGCAAARGADRGRAHPADPDPDDHRGDFTSTSPAAVRRMERQRQAPSPSATPALPEAGPKRTSNRLHPVCAEGHTSHFGLVRDLGGRPSTDAVGAQTGAAVQPQEVVRDPDRPCKTRSRQAAVGTRCREGGASKELPPPNRQPHHGSGPALPFA
jgi:hypothetical protein